MSHLTTVKNAFANVVRGGVGALIVILLPPFLTRILSKDAYGTWLLILQLSTYVSLLDFGIQTAVGRFVAHANELADTKLRDGVISTSLAILTGSGILAIFGMAGLAWQLPNLFKDMPSELHQEAQLALMLVGGSLAVGLPFSVFGGIFVGIQRYDIPAWIIGTSKLIGALFVVLIAHSSHSLAWMGLALALSNLGGFVWQFLAARKFARNMHISSSLVSKEMGKEIFGYCFSLSIWAFAMLLVSGLDAAIVGYVDYKSVSYYSVAASLVMFVAGLQSSTFAVLIPKSAELGARGDREKLGKLLVVSTRYGIFILLATGLPLAIFAKQILTLWVGQEYADRSCTILQILVIANIIRLSAVPYVNIMIGTGQQKLVVFSPLLEGMTNVLFSIVAGKSIGAIGVSIGTVVGSTIAILFNWLYNMPKTGDIDFSLRQYALNGILRPMICFVPLLICFVATDYTSKLFVCIACIPVVLTIAWFHVLEVEEKKYLSYKIYNLAKGGIQ